MTKCYLCKVDIGDEDKYARINTQESEHKICEKCYCISFPIDKTLDDH